MLMFNYSITILKSIIDFIATEIIPYLNQYLFEGFAITVIIYLASGSRAAKALDVTAKVIGSAAGSTFLYNYWVKGSSSSPNSGDKDENKKDKKEENKTINNQGTNGK